ncbi:HK97 gp10 family phage protein [Enterococcus sp. DIV1420a]|uniref:HK97 gp10 family phage protein n=1 Tax=Enterococcus sp. DIV1420a TaxID=2774672 RepID=UPI0036D48FE6
MGVTIKGLDRLRTKIKAMPKAISEAAFNATEETAELVQGRAVQNVQRSIKNGSGSLSSSIKKDAVMTDSKSVAHVWTDKKQGLYRELGTGPVGEASQKDLPPAVIPVYSQGPWFIPAKDAPDLEALYGMLRISIKGVDFFLTRGQPARPWLYPALKEGMAEAPDIFTEKINLKLKELAK